MPRKKDEKKKDKKANSSQEVRTPRIRKCHYCEQKTEPAYTDTAALKRFTSDRAKIVPSQRSGACSKHQRRVAKHIKYARHLALMPFINKI